MTYRIFIGWDTREQEAYRVAEHTARSFGCETIALRSDRLRATGMLTRPVDPRGNSYDFVSGAYQATDFAISRFFVPLLAHSGWCLFVDCDVVFLRDPRELFALADPQYAVMVVKHPPLDAAGTKMDGQAQAPYPRKNWSSVALWNCDHRANRRLNLTTLNGLPGRDLHAFSWLADLEIGELPAEWNWLVDVRQKPVDPGIAHYTQGGPWLPGWKSQTHDHIWTHASQR